jgi:hypothetical protein
LSRALLPWSRRRAIVAADLFNVMHPTKYVSLFFLAAACVLAEPVRQGGVSAHMLPKRVADLGDGKWGFVISFAPYLKPEAQQPVIQTVAALVAFVEKQDQGVRDNGLWIVITNPASYSDSELALLEDVKKKFRQKQIPLFICRGADLPNGWKRFDKDA